MGWLDDFVSNPIATVSNTVNREVSNFSNSVNAVVDNASRGDVGKFVVDSGSAVKSLAVAPLETVYYGVRGDGREVNNTLQRAIGGLINIAGGLSVNLAQNNQSFYRDKTLNTVTLGYAEDFAGFSRGARTLQNDAYLSPEDKNSAIRYGVKTGAIGATVAYGPGLYDKFMGLPGYQQLGAAGVAGSLVKGDAKGAASGFAKLTGTPDLSEYLPGPAQDVPSYISNPKSGGGSVGYAAPQVSDPWDIKGIADSGIAAVTDPTKLPIIIGVGFLGYLLYRRFK